MTYNQFHDHIERTAPKGLRVHVSVNDMLYGGTWSRYFSLAIYDSNSEQVLCNQYAELKDAIDAYNDLIGQMAKEADDVMAGVE